MTNNSWERGEGYYLGENNMKVQEQPIDLMSVPTEHGFCTLGPTPKPGVGVVVGRFQVADLHEGHQAVFRAADRHNKLLVLVGVQPSQLVTPSDPLDYPARERMIKEAYPHATVLPLPNQPTDVGWAKLVDDQIHALYPVDKATLYYGRKSFVDHYGGKHDMAEVEEEHKISGTELRDIDGSTVINHPDWRRGVIYASQNKYGSIYPCVDIAVLRAITTKQSEGILGSGLQILLGSRHNEGGKYRLPGGHVNVSDDGADAAARRELNEETGLECGYLNYVGNYKVKSWRDTEKGGVIFTTLFVTPYTFGGAKAGDDLDGLGWVDLDKVHEVLFADSHALLVSKVVDYVENGNYCG